MVLEAEKFNVLASSIPHKGYSGCCCSLYGLSSVSEWTWDMTSLPPSMPMSEALNKCENGSWYRFEWLHGRCIISILHDQNRLTLYFTEDELRNVGPVDAQVHLEEMSWNKDEESFSLSCRCGGKYTVYKDEAQEANLISCDTCSLIVELLHQSWAECSSLGCFNYKEKDAFCY